MNQPAGLLPWLDAHEQPNFQAKDYFPELRATVILNMEGTLSFDRTLTQLERLHRMRLGQPVLPKLEVHHSLT